MRTQVPGEGEWGLEAGGTQDVGQDMGKPPAHPPPPLGDSQNLQGVSCRVSAGLLPPQKRGAWRASGWSNFPRSPSTEDQWQNNPARPRGRTGDRRLG